MQYETELDFAADFPDTFKLMEKWCAKGIVIVGMQLHGPGGGNPAMTLRFPNLDIFVQFLWDYCGADPEKPMPLEMQDLIEGAQIEIKEQMNRWLITY